MDDTSTLSEVVTLLDSVDSSGSDVSSSVMLPTESESEDAPQSPLPVPKTTKKKKDRRRKEGPVVYSTDLQRRKKVELRALRAEAEMLGAQLQRMLQSRYLHIGSGGNTKNGSGWRALAAIESEKRELAERRNRELKAIMGRQQKVNSSIRKVLEKADAAGVWGMDLVFEPQPTSDSPLYPFDFSEAILAEISDSLVGLRLQTNKVFSVVGDDVPITCTTREKLGNTRGGVKCIETKSITPMNCAMLQAGEILWQYITTKKNKDVEKSFRFNRTRDPSSLERNCMAALCHGSGQVLNLDAVNIVRKYEEGNQVVLVGSTTWFLPTGGLQFEDHHWTVISPSPVDPLRSCVVQSCYQLQVKQVDTTTVLQEDYASTEEVVMSLISTKLRNVLQVQQDVLLEKANLIV